MFLCTGDDLTHAIGLYRQLGYLPCLYAADQPDRWSRICDIIGTRFAEMIDLKYRETTLRHHLDVAPLFAGLDEPAMDELRRGVELASFKAGDVIVEIAGDCNFLWFVQDKRGGAEPVRETGREASHQIGKGAYRSLRDVPLIAITG